MGQVTFKLCNITLRFMELNAFSASIKRTTSLSILANNISYGMNSSFRTSILTHTKLQRSCGFHNILFAQHHDYFTIDSPSTSPAPIGLKPGFLSNGINLLAVKASRNCVDYSYSEQSFLMTFAKGLRRSLDEFPNCLEVNILRQSTSSRPDGPEPPFVNIAARMTKDSLMSSYATG